MTESIATVSESTMKANSEKWNLDVQTQLNEPIRIRWNWCSAKSRACSAAEAGFGDNECALEDATGTYEIRGKTYSTRTEGSPVYNGMWLRCFNHGKTLLVIETIEEAVGALHEMNYRRSYSVHPQGYADAFPAEARSWERVGEEIRKGLAAQGLLTTEKELLELTYYGE